MRIHLLQLTDEELSVIYQTYDQIPLKGRAQRAVVAGIEAKIEQAFAPPEPAPEATEQ